MMSAGMSTAPPGPVGPAPDRTRPVRLDVIVPLYNEEAVVGGLCERLEQVFAPAACRRHRIADWRAILVDDGSTDAGAARVAERVAGPAGEHYALIRLSRNFGHQAAVSAGLAHADGDVAAVLDADLQDPPEVVLEMLERWRADWDVVYGVRRKRKEGVAKRAAYWAFYRVVRFLAEGRIPLDAGDFALLDRRALDALNALPERLRFVRGLRAWVGFRQTGLEYERAGRAAGTPKYTWSMLYRLATDGIASAGIRPLKVIQFGAAAVFVLGLVPFVEIVGGLLRRSGSGAGQGPSVALGVIWLAAVFQLLGLYILAAYVGRTYLEVKGRPGWIVMEILDGRHAAPRRSPGG